jgi:hypothetical protein
MRRMVFGALAVSTAAALSSALALPSGAAPSRPAPFKISATGFRLASQQQLSGGNVQAIYHKGGVVLKVAAPSGSGVTADSTDTSATGSVTTPDPKTETSSRSASSYMASGQSLIDNALAVGFTPRQAYAVAQNLGVHLAKSVTIAGVSARRADVRWGSRGTGSDSAGAVTASTATILNSPCISLSGDGGHATSRFCDVQRKVQANGLDWYLGDSGTGTASDVNGWKLIQFRGNTQYSSGNSEVQWRPNGTVDVGSCSVKTFGITYNGVSISSSATSCPAKLDPYLATTHFGVNWSGCNHNQDGIAPVDLVHSPASASAAITVDIKIAWSSWTSSCT